MSDGANFYMNDFGNIQNFQHWANENSQMMQEKLLHTQRVTVWCAIMHDSVIGPYLFENEDGHRDCWWRGVPQHAQYISSTSCRENS